MKFIILLTIVFFSCTSIESIFPKENNNIKTKFGSLEGVIYWKESDSPGSNLAYKITGNGFSRQNTFKDGHFIIDSLPDGRYSLSIFNENFEHQFGEYLDVTVKSGSLTYFTAFLPDYSKKMSHNKFVVYYNDTSKTGLASGTVDFSDLNGDVKSELEKDVNFYGEVVFFRDNESNPSFYIEVDSLGKFYEDGIKPGIYKAYFFKKTEDREGVRSTSLLGIIVLPEKECITQFKYLKKLSSYRSVFDTYIINNFWDPHFVN